MGYIATEERIKGLQDQLAAAIARAEAAEAIIAAELTDSCSCGAKSREGSKCQVCHINALLARAEAAEARVAEFTEYLTTRLNVRSCCQRDEHRSNCVNCKSDWALLSRTPAHSLAIRQAKDAVVEAAQAWADGGFCRYDRQGNRNDGLLPDALDRLAELEAQNDG